MATRLSNINVVCLSLILSLSILFGCDKDELTHPVKVNFNIKINQATSSQSYLTLSKSVFCIGTISFIGLRQQGGDVHFDTKPGVTHGTIIMNVDQPEKFVTYFDLPQGVYNYMGWDLSFSEIDDDVFEDEIIDSDDFGMVIIGNYTKINGEVLPIYFAISSDEKFSCETTNSDNTTPVSIVKNNTYNLLIEMNPAEAVEGISRDYFEQAVIENDDDEIKYIMVSSESNISLYQLFLFRLERILKATMQ